MKKVLISIILLLLPIFASADDRTARALVSATEKVSISSEISARVEKINFLLGDAFKKGDVLISFDCELYKAQNEVIKSNYETAKIQLENDKQLLEMRSIGKLQYQLSVSAMNKAKAELKISTFFSLLKMSCLFVIKVAPNSGIKHIGNSFLIIFRSG